MLSDSRRNIGIDFLRGVAIVLVLIFHYMTKTLDAQSGELSRVLIRFTYYFNSGVDLFFVISGFLITGILLKQREQHHFAVDFIKRRIARIVPLYFIGVIIVYSLFTTGMFNGSEWGRNDNIPWYSYLIFGQNEWMALQGDMGSRMLAPYWSLGIEIQFYILILIMAWIFSKGQLAILFTAGIILAPFFRIMDGGVIGSYTHFYCRMDSVFAGGLIAWIFSSKRNELYFHSIRRHMRFIQLILILLAIAITIRLIKVPSSFIPTFFMFLFGIALMVAYTSSDYIRSSFVKSVLIFLGRYSYGIYIFHEIWRGTLFFALVGHAPQLINFRDLSLTLLSLVVTMVSAFLSYHSIERYFLRTFRSAAST